MFDYLNPQLFHLDLNLQWLRINQEAFDARCLLVEV